MKNLTNSYHCYFVFKYAQLSYNIASNLNYYTLLAIDNIERRIERDMRCFDILVFKNHE